MKIIADDARKELVFGTVPGLHGKVKPQSVMVLESGHEDLHKAWGQRSRKRQQSPARKDPSKLKVLRVTDQDMYAVTALGGLKFCNTRLGCNH